MTFPDAGWLKALQLPGKIFAGLFLFSALVLIFDYLAIINLSDIGVLPRPLVIIAALLFGSLSVAALGGAIYDAVMQHRKVTLLSARREIRRAEADRDRAEYEARVLKRLDYLSKDEIRYVADCLRKNEQSFLTYAHSPPVANLAAKEFVQTIGGSYHREHYPFYFVDFVWAALLERKDEFLAKDDEHKRQEATLRGRTNRLLPP
jgi:hypothetical protein